jgi:SMC interacting uncharacterized protein involved in chromosome segregation
MPDHTNDIAELLDNLDGGYWPEKHAALTALVAERDALRKRVKELESHNSVSVRLLLAERDGLKQENDELRSRCKAAQDEVLDRVFEMDWLRKRVAELVSKADELAAAIKQRDEAHGLIRKWRLNLVDVVEVGDYMDAMSSEARIAMNDADKRAFLAATVKEGGGA